MKSLRRVQAFHLSRFSLLQTIREIPFWIILGIIVAIMVSITFYDTTFYNAKTLPKTYFILDVIRRFEKAILITALVYYAEDFWKARTLGVHLITNTFPTKNGLYLSGKIFGIIGVYLIILSVLFLSGVLVQTFRGFYEYNMALYFSVFTLEFLPRFLIFLLLSTVFHLLFEHKFIAIGATILLVFSGNILAMMSLNNPLLDVDGIDFGVYSELNGYSNTFESIFSKVIFLMAIASIFGVIFFKIPISPTNEDGVIRRISAIKNNWTLKHTALLTFLLIVIAVTSIYIKSQTELSNDIKTKKERLKWMADYEKTLKPYELSKQLIIKDVQLTVDLYPAQKEFKAMGSYTLENIYDDPIDRIHIQNNPHPAINVTAISFDKETSIDRQFEEFDYQQFLLKTPLGKGEQIEMKFEVSFLNNEFGGLGMAHGMAFHGVVKNGTFINESFFPRIGYRSGWEISSNSIREKHDLPPKDRMMAWNDSNVTIATSRFFSKTSIDFIISTNKEQVVVAPGKLINNWHENDRNYFKFESRTPVEGQFVILSGDYEVLKDEFKSAGQEESVSLKVYHHPGHFRNVPNMMKSLKASLKYCEANFSSFQYDQLQIVEFPRYSIFAQSVPNTIPFSEDIGFNMDIKDGDADVPYFITAHEVSHQWWGDQLQGSWAQGIGMLSETLAQYSAAMIYKKEYGMEALDQVIQYERNRYLKGRSKEINEENPLVKVESQSYIHYGKGLISMLALEAYVGEINVNKGLASFLNEWHSDKMNHNHPTTPDLIDHLRVVTPDSLQFLVSDLFEKIVLNDIRLQSVQWKQAESEAGILSLRISASKTSYNGIGEELEVKDIKWIPVAIYDDGLISYNVMPIGSDGTIKVKLDRKPQKVKLDPYHLMIERNNEDNSFRF